MRRRTSSSLAAGFSLIEILAVVLIVAVIVAFAVPSYRGAMQKSRRAEGKMLLQVIMAAEERSYSRTNRYTDSVADLGLGEPVVSAPGGYYAMVRVRLVDDAQLVAVTVDPQRSQSGDDCGSLTLDSSGRRGAAGPAGGGNGCW